MSKVIDSPTRLSRLGREPGDRSTSLCGGSTPCYEVQIRWRKSSNSKLKQPSTPSILPRYSPHKNTSKSPTMNAEANPVSCPPPMNSDISGIGVRLSFYIQTWFLSIFSVWSTSFEDTEASFTSLISISLAMSITFFSSGFKNNPTVTLQDGLVVSYLLAMSFLSITFSSTSYNRFIGSKKIVHVLSVIQALLIFGSFFALLAKMKSFGSSQSCNSEALVFFFRSFKALKYGQVVGSVFASIAFICYVVITWKDIRPASRSNQPQITRSSSNSEGQNSASASSRNSSRLITHRHTLLNPTKWDTSVALKIAFVSVSEAICIWNTELLIRRNKPIADSDSQWQFGQILALVMLIQPMIGFYNYCVKSRTNLDHQNDSMQLGSQSETPVSAESRNQIDTGNELQSSTISAEELVTAISTLECPRTAA
ncbi:hypothetical protein SCHPADRAFT_567879 [Schizopora paradoxa]|uniref:Uncharacterized protein n=1 Tax=Schizopora paradoxa TaxID=27342 RepID=A0A0H2RIY8_9AGAM|nr:hypothetical protein SCHPADRAFT_567879 [Schizopora paradoxa]